MKGREAEGITSFSLPLESNGEDEGLAFVPNEVYLEVRVSQIWLTQERELWREFQPFAAIVTSFLHQGEERTLPAMLGSSELGSKISKIEAEDAIEIRNIRVAGPVPYEGDDVSVLSTLFRAKTKDWATRTLDLVEQIAGAIGTPALIAAKPIADVMVSAVSQFVDDDGFQLRCGQYQSWSSPDNPKQPTANELKPMHYVIMRKPVDKGKTSLGEGFTVKDGRLHTATGNETKPYTDHDFLMLSLEPRERRDDYRSFDFYKHWQQTQALIAEGDLVSAERVWRKTVGAIYTDELVESQQQTLYAEYKRRYDEMVDRFATADARSAGSGAAAISLDQEDPAEILLAAGK